MARSQKGKVAETLKAAAKKMTRKTVAKKAAPKKAAPKKASASNHGIKKEYVKSKKLCKVTFRLPRIAVSNAKSACIVGDFNNWNIYASPMKRLRGGDYTITLELKPGNEYQFRYLIDESRWENDWNADKYVKGPYGDTDNSVVVI
jgi:1,4-alpha-glucan branching enzyme